MKTDICNAPVGLQSATALGHWNAMVRAFLAHGTQTPVHLAAVLEAEPDFALGHAARGLFSLMLGRAEMRQTAQAAQTAAHLAEPQDARARCWVAALDHWLADRPSAAVAAMESILAAQPQDTLSAKVSHAIRFVLGDPGGMRASVERLLPAHGPDHSLRGYLMGCHAFALEETGDFTGAERAGLAGLEHAPDDAWGLHAVTHVHDMRADPDAGIALIDTHAGAWEKANNFRYHVWWHKALLHLDRNEKDAALAIYDRQVRAERTDDYRDIANATSLLMRLELDGVGVGARWQELSELSAARVGDGCLVFADLHYMLALCGTADVPSQEAMTARFARDAARPGEMSARYADPGQAALAGLRAFAEGKYAIAFRALAVARPSMQSIGGSHAQRDVFERMTIDAGLRAGHFDATESILMERLALRGGHADRFTTTRFDSLSRTRRIPAQ